MPEITYTKKQHIAYMTISHPEKMNAMTSKMRQQWEEALADFRDDPEMRVALVTGAGDKAFCTGPDLTEEAGPMATRAGDHANFWQTSIKTREDWRDMQIWKPIVAAVNGYCIAGGFEMALLADIIICSDNASFGFTEGSLSRVPGAGGTQKLPRRIPFGMAMQMLLTCERIGAEEALRVGLVNKVVPKAELMSEAEKIAKRIASFGPLAMRAIKELAWRGTFEMNLSEGLRLERMYALINRDTQDASEGPRAWLEKRDPDYKGK